MASDGGGILCGFLLPRAFLWQPTRGGLTVDWTTILALAVAVVLLIYLAAALLAPEMFS